MQLSKFKKIVWDYYKSHGRRDLPWRLTRDPYKILVSEIMLQQTQVSRVIPKYKSFLKKFPNVGRLAHAPLKDVLNEWQGLGYNRRGLYLKQCAEKIVADFGGKFPRDLKILTSLPGIGPTTAGDILAFAWNIPIVVIETNIRSVFIHHFSASSARPRGDSCKIYDREILPLIEKTLDQKNPREWYYALMDYGAYLKTQIQNPSRKSAHHVKQSTFKGSNREMRANILKLILKKSRTEKEIIKITKYTPINIQKNLKALVVEGLITKKSSKYAVI